jgi:hypothetical protein
MVRELFADGKFAEIFVDVPLRETLMDVKLGGAIAPGR